MGVVWVFVSSVSGPYGSALRHRTRQPLPERWDPAARNPAGAEGKGVGPDKERHGKRKENQRGGMTTLYLMVSRGVLIRHRTTLYAYQGVSVHSQAVWGQVQDEILPEEEEKLQGWTYKYCVLSWTTFILKKNIFITFVFVVFFETCLRKRYKLNCLEWAVKFNSYKCYPRVKHIHFPHVAARPSAKNQHTKT